jgi:hypothetical protein
MSLHEICNWFVLFLKIIASLVAVVLLLHPFSFSFFTVFTTLSFLLVLYNYLLHTCFWYSFGVHILSSLSSLSTFYICLINVFLLHSILETLHLLFHFIFLPLFPYSEFNLLLFYPNFPYFSTYCHSSSKYSVPCPVTVHICTDKTNTVLFVMEREVSPRSDTRNHFITPST